MYIDATELLSITVDGQEHSYDATVDSNHDGTADTVRVDTDHGSYEYTDTDGDGVADTLTQFDGQGHATGHAVFDAATGGWDDPANATIDSNNDGVADTAVSRTADGSTVLVTDTDRNGSPDAITEINRTGQYSSYQTSADGAWTEVDHGDLADERPAPAATGHPAVIDPETGLWTTQ